MQDRNPGIQLPGQVGKVLRGGRQRGTEGIKKPYEYRGLYYYRAQASQWIHALLFVEPHGLLGRAGLVVAVSVLDLLHLRLEGDHGLHLPGLPDRKRHHRSPYDNGEDDDT